MLLDVLYSPPHINQNFGCTSHHISGIRCNKWVARVPLKGYGECQLAFKPRSLGYQLKIVDLFGNKSQSFPEIFHCAPWRMTILHHVTPLCQQFHPRYGADGPEFCHYPHRWAPPAVEIE